MATRNGASATADKLPAGFRFAGDAGTQGGDDSDDSSVVGGQRSDDGSGDGGRSVIDPGSIDPNTGDTGTGTGGKRRGRKPGGRNKTGGKTSTTKTTDSLSAILHSVHMMGSLLLGIPEILLTQDEAKQLAEAVNRVTELYDIPLMDEKTYAWVQLGMVASTIYGPRIATVVLKTPKKGKTSGKVVDMPSPGQMAN